MNAIKKIIFWILRIESRLIVRKYKPFIVAVTGSVGKTSTKDAVYSVLKNQGGYVRKSDKSFNSEIGLPLTIIGVPNAWRNMNGWISNISRGADLIFSRRQYPDCLILEIGADHPNDIRKVTRWLKPDMTIITRISQTPVHVEFFSSPQEVFEEKAALAEAVKLGGSLILFADEPHMMSLADRVAGKGVNVISYGSADSAVVRGTHDQTLYDPTTLVPAGTSFMLHLDGTASAAGIPITVNGILGRGYMLTLLAAAAAGKARGMSPEKIASSLMEYKAPRGRLNILPGINGSTIIDDSYNSSPDATFIALETLKSLSCSGAKIAVLGDMMELGKYSSEEHRKAGTLAAGIATSLVTVGPRSRSGTADEAIKAGMSPEAVHPFATAWEAGAYLATVVKAGDIVLVKGSQSMRTERVVKPLLRDQSRAEELLVRQEKEWLDKL